MRDKILLILRINIVVNLRVEKQSQRKLCSLHKIFSYHLEGNLKFIFDDSVPYYNNKKRE